MGVTVLILTSQCWQIQLFNLIWHFGKNGAQHKTRQKGEISSMWYHTEFDSNVLFIHLCTRKMPFNALVFILHSKVDLICIEHTLLNLLLIAHQSVQFTNIARKLNIDLCLFFSH